MNNYIKIIIAILLISINYNYVNAQNERFKGGQADGAAVSNSSVNFDDVAFIGDDLTVQINRAAGQEETTTNSTINYSVIFSEAVLEFTPDDINISGTAEAGTVQITGSGTNYNVEVSGMKSNGTVIADILAGNVQNSVGNPNQAATTDGNEVLYTGADLTVEITRATGQAYITNKNTVHFTASFNEAVTDFDNSDITLSGSANANSVSVSGSDKNYDIEVSGMATDGDITINIPAGVAHDEYGKANNESTNTENVIMYDITNPDVEIKLAEGQANPAYELPLLFKVIFSEDVVDFSTYSVSFGGSAGLSIAISGNGSEYTVAMDGVLTNETVTITVAEGVVHDFVGNPNNATVNTENSITYMGTTSIKDINNRYGTNIYYNTGNIVVTFDEIPKGKVLLEIFNIQGQEVLKKEIGNKVNRIPVKSLSNYLIRLSGSDFLQYKKVFTN